MIRVEHVLTARCELGEGPLWNSADAALYWTDILYRQIHRLDPATGSHTVYPVGVPVGAFAFQQSGALLFAAANCFAAWSPENTVETLVQFAEISSGQRFNDGKVDPGGRFWAGTMGGGAVNRLYRLDANLSVHVMLDGISISNGIGWSPNSRTMYYTDSPTGNIYAFDFDLQEGSLSRQRIFAQIPPDMGVPDGLCVDASGGVWSAIWDGWRILRFNPDGSLDQTIRLPVQRPTSCAFGGANLETLFITSARTELTPEQLAHQPLAGDIFAVNPGFTGMPAAIFAG